LVAELAKRSALKHSSPHYEIRRKKEKGNKWQASPYFMISKFSQQAFNTSKASVWHHTGAFGSNIRVILERKTSHSVAIRAK
jgi:hypothetical protein